MLTNQELELILSQSVLNKYMDLRLSVYSEVKNKDASDKYLDADQVTAKAQVLAAFMLLQQLKYQITKK